MHSRYLTKRINHTKAYSTDDACTNQAESFFSWLRRAEFGMRYHIAGPYLSAYTDEIAWREDNRRRSTAELYLAMAGGAQTSGVAAVERVLATNRVSCSLSK